MSVSFETVAERAAWSPIPNCPGRWVIRGRTTIPLESLVGDSVALEFKSPHTEDDVLLVRFDGGGGLLTFRKPNGTLVHTLNTAEGLQRRMAKLGLEVPEELFDSSLGA